jgi:hypothetical protein
MPRRGNPDGGENDVLALRKQVQELVSAGRFRTAMDEVLRHLRHDPSNSAVLALAVTITVTSRTEHVGSPEPVTTAQMASALLAPIATGCSACGRVWYSYHEFFRGMQISLLNPAGLQCQDCRYTLCRDCLGPRPSHVPQRVERPCPAPGCRGMLTVPVLATGRHDVVDIDPDDIERVVVVRDGPIAPTMDEALAVVTKFVPLWGDDTSLVGIRRGFPGMMDDALDRDRLASYLVHGMERDGELAPGAWERAEPLFLRATHEDDTDYLVTVVRRPGSTHDPGWHRHIADLMREHVRRMRGKGATTGACWAGIDGDAMIDATATLLHQSFEEARRTHELATSTSAIPGYAIAATVVRTPDLGALPEAFDGRYGGFCMELYNTLCDALGDQDQQNFVHWVMVTDGSMIKLDATVFPADRDEMAILAVDLMSRAEREELGL